MTNRDEFSDNVRQLLAERVGYRCSFPGCKAITIGPSNERPAATSNVGMACHITAAASGRGARRYDRAMRPEERSSIENGIWMCYTHGKLIDTDEARFTVPMLKRWRELAEIRASLGVQLGRPIELSPADLPTRILVEHSVQLPNQGPENQAIGDALHDSCVPIVWGSEIADAIRDALIEIARNARCHGRARDCEIRIEPNSIRLFENGTSFNPWFLPSLGREGGGTRAVRHLLDSYGERLIVESCRNGDLNVHILALPSTVEHLRSITPCIVQLHRNENFDFEARLDIIESCDTVYTIIPPYTVESDLEDLLDAVKSLLGGGRKKSVVFVVTKTSVRVRGEIVRRFPDCRLVVVEN